MIQLSTGFFEFVLMPFSLVNVPVTLNRRMKNLFRDEICKCVVCYLDDILVFSESWSET